MFDFNQNYSGKKDKKKKAATALIFLLCPLLLLIGVASAFFSDVISQDGSIKSGTLKLSGSYEYFVNDGQAAVSAIGYLNPGDVIVVKGTITNTGNKSAWIRDEITFDSQDLLPAFKIYQGSFTKDEVVSGGSSLDSYLVAPSVGGAVYSSVRVIDGTGSDAETENGGSYQYVGDNKYTVYFTVYFLSTAGNEFQGKTVNFTASTKAIQFRNNDSLAPDDTAWAAVLPVTPAL